MQIEKYLKPKDINEIINSFNDINELLLIICYNGHVDIFKKIYKQANINVKNDPFLYKNINFAYSDYTPLMMCLRALTDKLFNKNINNYLEIIQLLLNDKRLKINIKNQYGNTALKFAKLHGSNENICKVIKLFNDKGYF